MTSHEIVKIGLLILIPCSALVIPLIAAAKWPGRWWLFALIVGCTFPTYMLAAGLITRSNLWPIGVVIGCVMTMPAAFIGAGAGAMIGRRRRVRQAGSPDMPALAG